MYFAHLDQTNQPANQLQREAVELLHDSSDLLVADPDKFLADLKTAIADLNKKHSRCTPLVVSTCSRIPDDCINIYLGAITVRFQLYKVRNKEAANV